MRILITGDEGYIGSVARPFIAAAGHHVTGWDAGWFRDRDEESDASRTEPRRDIRHATAADLERFDAIIHLAALSNDPLGNLDPELTWAINVEASARLARAAKEAGVQRFLLSSSCSMYGASGDALVDEESPLQRLTVYARAKVQLEQQLMSLADDKFTPTFLRNGTVYGASPALRLDLVLNDLAAGAFTSGRIFMLSDGTPWRPLVHVEDVARAFLAVLDAGRDVIHNQAFNVGIQNANYQMLELAEIVKEVCPWARIEFAPGAGSDDRCYRVDFSKIRSFLPSFRPSWTPRAGVEELCAFFASIDLRAEDVDGSRYRRLQSIRRLMNQGRVTPDLLWRQSDGGNQERSWEAVITR
jgi:nucleoside-diphosphate-sugar epimerase